MPNRAKPEGMNPTPVAVVMEIDEANGDDLPNLGLNSNSAEDICKIVLDRYSKSSTSQHRHLCASACAMRSILTDEGLPLIPTAYLAAVLTAIREADHADRDQVAALSSFLSILLPLVPVGSVLPSKAKDASFSVIKILKAPPEVVATTMVRSLVKCLGFLLLCLDLGDWATVEVPLEVLFKFSIDRRPKVRKCAQMSIKKAFIAFSTSKIIKKAVKFLMSMFRSYVSLDCLKKSGKRRSLKSEHIEALHLLNVIAHIVPKLPKKTISKFLPETCKLLGCQFSLLARPVLVLLEVLLEHLVMDVLISEADRIISVLSSYMSFTEVNPVDTILFASVLLKKVLNKLHPSMPSLWLRNFPHIFSSLAGFLNSKTVIAKCAADILVELIECHVDRNIFSVDAKMTCSDSILTSPESSTIMSVCTVLEYILGGCSGVPNEHILEVLTQLFQKLGDMSFFFMSNIIHQLSKWALQIEDLACGNPLQECVGCAVVAIGPEKMLSLFPISFLEENLTCSNAWLVPILRKYVSGASLKFFVEHIAPIITSVKASFRKVKGSKACKDLHSCIQDLWSLLPAFCHYPMDTSQNFDLLARFLVSNIKDDPSTHETILVSLKILVNENKSVLGAGEVVKSTKMIVNDAADDIKILSCASLEFCYTKEVASKNIEAMASGSVNLLAAVINVFFLSSPEKRLYLKEGIEYLSSIMLTSDVAKFALSLLKNIDNVCTTDGYEDPENHSQPSFTSENVGQSNDEEKDEKKRCLAMELVSCFIVRLDKDLVYRIYNCIRHFLLEAGNVHCESYFTLSRILKEHCWFCLEKADEVIDLVIGVKLPSDISLLKGRLCCLHFLLVHLIKSEEEEQKKKIFLILNETILTLKNSDEEVRKTAYDMLSALACSLRNLQFGNSASQLNELLIMIMGYFSGSSSQIISGAVAAISLLIYKDSDLCLSVPELLPSVLSLLKRKQVEVTKAALGFIKVLVSSLHANELSSLLPKIANGTLPWSLVSKNHFRAKVRLIFEIIIRKCGVDSVNMVVAEKYRSFINSIQEQRRNRASSKRNGKPSTAPLPVESSLKGARKRKHVDASSSAGNKDLKPSRKVRKDNEIQKEKFVSNDKRRPVHEERTSRRAWKGSDKPRPSHEEHGRRNYINKGDSSISEVSLRGKYNKKLRMGEKPRRIKRM